MIYSITLDENCWKSSFVRGWKDISLSRSDDAVPFYRVRAGRYSCLKRKKSPTSESCRSKKFRCIVHISLQFLFLVSSRLLPRVQNIIRVILNVVCFRRFLRLLFRNLCLYTPFLPWRWCSHRCRCRRLLLFLGRLFPIALIMCEIDQPAGDR